MNKHLIEMAETPPAASACHGRVIRWRRSQETCKYGSTFYEVITALSNRCHRRGGKMCGATEGNVYLIAYSFAPQAIWPAAWTGGNVKLLSRTLGHGRATGVPAQLMPRMDAFTEVDKGERFDCIVGRAAGMRARLRHLVSGE